jgi:tetratricopeptide (TPR) repeat protein
MYEDAAWFYRKALLIQPLCAEAYLGLGACFYWQGAKELAEKNLKKALKIDPLYFECRNFLANQYFSAKRHEEAIAQFERVPLDVQNDSLSVKRMIFIYRKNGAPSKKIEALKEVLKRLKKEQSWDYFLAQIKKRPSSGRA